MILRNSIIHQWCVYVFHFTFKHERIAKKFSQEATRQDTSSFGNLICVHAKLTRNQPFPSGLPISKSSNDQQVLLNNEMYLNGKNVVPRGTTQDFYLSRMVHNSTRINFLLGLL